MPTVLTPGHCLARNGGIEALHFADYNVDFDGGRRAGNAPSQIFRLEGAAAVFHFRGEPHVHAFIHVAEDADQQVSLGEPLGENPTVLQGAGLQALFETAMRAQAQADFAYYPEASVVGRLRAGMIRTGDLWVAENWVDELVVAEPRGADLGPAVLAALRTRGADLHPDKRYRIATTGYVARDESVEAFGGADNRRSLGLLRDAIAAHLRLEGFPRAA